MDLWDHLEEKENLEIAENPETMDRVSPDSLDFLDSPEIWDRMVWMEL